MQAAFNIGAMIRWLDFNDTWLAAEWGHPSDNLGGILASRRLALAYALARTASRRCTMRDVLTAMIKAHEIQGCIALENSFNKVGLDHVVLVKVASTAVVCQLLGLTREQTINAHLARLGRRPEPAHLSPRAQHRLAQKLGRWRRHQPRRSPGAHGPRRRDGLPIRAHRKNLGLLRRLLPRAAVQIPAPLRLLRHGERALQDQLPAEFHAQTAVEAAMKLHARLDAARQICRQTFDDITIRTHEACLRIIDKKGPLANPADRDHCVQYMVAIPLLFGRLTAADYEDAIAVRSPRIDALRAKIDCVEEPQFTATITTRKSARSPMHFASSSNDGTVLEETVEYPIGHASPPRRPALARREVQNQSRRRFAEAQQQRILDASLDRDRLEAMPVNDYVDLYVRAVTVVPAGIPAK